MKIRKSLLVSLVLLFGALSTSAQAETVAQALKKCGQVQNSLKRLVCYDQIVNDMNRYGNLDDLMQVPAPLAANGTGERPQVPATQAAPVQRAPAQAAQNSQADADADFGMEQKAMRENAKDKIYATIVKVTKNARKKRIFTLDNGHVWRETESNSLSLDVNDLIYVERGALGSFHLSKDGVNRRVRVKRVK